MLSVPLIAALLLLSTLIGSAARVTISGMDAKQTKHFSSLLKPRLEFINSRPATSWRADDAAFFLRRLLLRSGYADCDVNWSLRGSDTIILKVAPGAKFRFGEVTADRLGPLDQKLLDDYFFQPLIDTELVPRDQAPYQQDYPIIGAENVHNYLKSIGYWSSSVSVARTRIDPKAKCVNIQLTLREGPRHTLLAPRFSGINERDLQYLQNRFVKFTGKAATTERITRIHGIVTDYFRERGNHLAQIDISAKHGKSTTQLEFQITPGDRYKLRRVSASGQYRTKKQRITRFYDKLKKKYYDAKAADKATTHLLSTGAFSSVSIETIPRENQKLDLLIHVEEGKDKAFRSYAGLGSFEGFILGTSYSDMNFTGRLLRFNARGEISNRGLLGEVSLTDPFFAGEPIRFSTRAFSLMRQFDSYDKSEHGIDVSWAWEPAEYLSTRLFTTASTVNTSTTGLSHNELGPSTYLDTRVGIEQSFDFRDNQILPKKGFHANLLAEFGTIAGNASTSYFHTDVKTSFRYPINDDQRLVARFNLGAIYPAESLDLPIDRRLFAGGADSVRSFQERTLGPRALNGSPLGGEAYWESSLEFIQSFSETFSGVVFYDTGQVYPHVDDFSFNNPSHAIGLGLRIDLPIGPVRLEYGYNLNRKDHEPAGAFHFSIGTTF